MFNYCQYLFSIIYKKISGAKRMLVMEKIQALGYNILLIYKISEGSEKKNVFSSRNLHINYCWVAVHFAENKRHL